jgi:hypothetical protein
MRTTSVNPGERAASVSTEPRQYSRTKVIVVWAAAALPMAALAWIVAPAVAGRDATPQRLALALLFALTAGLLWQALIGQGWSNHEIAERLVIAESTAKTYVKRILAKIDARDRAQAVVFAYESGLVIAGQS